MTRKAKQQALVQFSTSLPALMQQVLFTAGHVWTSKPLILKEHYNRGLECGQSEECIPAVEPSKTLSE